MLTRRRSVWIICHSIMYWAGENASLSGWGPDLGLGNCLQISWLGQRGMRWTTLLPTIRREVRTKGHPQAVIIQLGGNDLPKKTSLVLSHDIKRNLHTIRQGLPGTQLFWSCLLERRTWRGRPTQRKWTWLGGELARRWISSSGEQEAKLLGTQTNHTAKRPCTGRMVYTCRNGGWIFGCMA